MATPLPLIPGAASSPSVAPPIDDSGAAVKSPILMFLYFHKAIRLELDCLHKAAVEFATCGDGDIWSIRTNASFLLRFISITAMLRMRLYFQLLIFG